MNTVRGATVWCIPGGHAVDVMTDWTMVRATVTDDGSWIPDPESPAMIPVCQFHPI